MTLEWLSILFSRNNYPQTTDGDRIIYVWRRADHTHIQVGNNGTEIIDPKDFNRRISFYTKEGYEIKTEEMPPSKSSSQLAPKSVSQGRRFRSTSAAHDQAKDK